MFKRLTTLIATLALATPAEAGQLKDYIYSNVVLAEVHRSGTTIQFKHERCSKGIFGSYTPKTDVMVLCIENHSDFPELADTIRHEAIHIIQTCKGGPVLSFQQVASYAKPEDYKAMNNYSTHSHHHELEAAIGARSMTDAQVVTTFKSACYKND